MALKWANLSIHHIKDYSGVWLKNPVQIQHQAASFFRDSLCSQLPPSHYADVDFFPQHVPSVLQQQDNELLLASVSLSEMRKAVFLLDADSASGPNGYPGSFYRSCWDIISVDLHAAVVEFFIEVPVPRGVSHALIVLLPK